jgi:hypothetical protein
MAQYMARIASEFVTDRIPETKGKFGIDELNNKIESMKNRELMEQTNAKN